MYHKVLCRVTRLSRPLLMQSLSPVGRIVDSEEVKWILLALAVIALIGCASPDNRPLVTKVPGDRREFEIVQADHSPHQAAAIITFTSSFGIFAFDLNLAGRKLNRLTLIVRNQRYCEGLSFQDRAGHWTDLRQVEGVQVQRKDSNMVVEIAPPALDLMKEGGRVQFVNQYR